MEEKAGGKKSKDKFSVPAQYAELYVSHLPMIRNLVDATTAATRPTVVWTANFIDRLNLLLSMNGNDDGVLSLSGNILSWYFEGHQIEKRIVSAVRDGRGGYVFDLIAFAHGVLQNPGPSSGLHWG